MPTVGFHCSHTQISPSQLLRDVRHAEAAGFAAATCSDHLAPWSTRQGQAGNAWTWLGAALALTGLPIGVITAPGQRYHPAVLAQSMATLAQLFPGRFWAALGSGQAINEHVTGQGWQREELRERRLVESVEVIRRLLAGEEVTHDGLVSVDRARLWSLPDAPPEVAGAAKSPQGARRQARWAQGLMALGHRRNMAGQMLREYRAGGGRGLARIQLLLSWAPSEDEAIEIAMDQWRSNIFGPPVCFDVDSVEAFDEMARHVSEADVRQVVHVSSDLDAHAATVQDALDLGFDEVYLHFVGQRQERFITAFGHHVLPAFADPPEPGPYATSPPRYAARRRSSTSPDG